jgi:hypothetical protein
MRIIAQDKDEDGEGTYHASDLHPPAAYLRVVELLRSLEEGELRGMIILKSDCEIDE